MDIQQAVHQTASLLDMPCDRGLRVEELIGSPSLRARLYAMGILPGTEMELCAQPCGTGSVCVRVRQCSLVLGESMARAILCRAMDSDSPDSDSPDSDSPDCAAACSSGHVLN